MEIGFNDDVEYKDVRFHIQTEDHGLDDPRVSSQLFTGGRVLDNRVVNYGPLIADINDTDARKSKVRRVMVASHRNLYKRLLSGEYDDVLELEESVDIEDKSISDQVEAFMPSQSRVPEAAQVVEDEEGRVTFTFDHGEEMDLSSLCDQLNQIDVLPPEEGNSELFADMVEEVNMRSKVTEVFNIEELRRQGLDKVNLNRKTGKRAFSGLLEPPAAGDDLLAMVEVYLEEQQR